MIGIGAVKLPGISRRCFKRSVWHLRTDYGIFVSNPREALSQYGRLFASRALGGAGRIFCSLRVRSIFPDTL